MRRIPLFVSALVGLAAAVTAPAAQAQNAAAGAATFKQQCQMCHVNTAGAKGFAAPNLWGVVGRKAASEAGYSYSDGLQKAGWTWDPKRLDEWIKNPRAMVPDTKMTFLGVKNDKDRADIVAFLKLQGGE